MPSDSERAASVHRPVLAAPVVELLQPQRGQLIVDGTLGGGGHTRLLADAVGAEGLVLALDRDVVAIARARRELDGRQVQAVQANFCNLPEVLEACGMTAVHHVLLDLGVSSDQLADQERGFSFHASGALDLRFDTGRGEPAWKLINRLSAEHLANLIYEYGEERFSRRIARALVAARRQMPLRDAVTIADIVRRAVPKRKSQRIDAATRTFQALRIAVNDELRSLEIALRRLPECMHPGGRLAVISFHSLEDRLVKDAFRRDDRYGIITRKPIRPSEEEVRINSRSRSARLRVAEIRKAETG